MLAVLGDKNAAFASSITAAQIERDAVRVRQPTDVVRQPAKHVRNGLFDSRVALGREMFICCRLLHRVGIYAL